MISEQYEDSTNALGFGTGAQIYDPLVSGTVISIISATTCVIQPDDCSQAIRCVNASGVSIEDGDIVLISCAPDGDPIVVSVSRLTIRGAFDD